MLTNNHLRKDRKYKWRSLELKLNRINRLSKDKNWELILKAECEYPKQIFKRLIQIGRRHCRVEVSWNRPDVKNLDKIKRKNYKILCCKFMSIKNKHRNFSETPIIKNLSNTKGYKSFLKIRERHTGAWIKQDINRQSAI